jgi:membrane-bound metal-dependent hydrolase YbcI (DUF457 family)
MSLGIILGIIITHFIADFICQTEKQAQRKSSSCKYLLGHTITYTMVWLVVGLVYVFSNLDVYNNWALSKFLAITFIAHTVTDYFTSRLSKKNLPESYNVLLRENPKEDVKLFWHYPKGQRFYNFFVVVGGDQVLHYIQLFLTYYLLTK